MKRWKKAASIAAALTLTVAGGAGVAWAQAQDNPAGPGATTSAARVLGGTTRETIFVPITPCRLVDTREAVGPLTNGLTRSYDVRGTGGTFAGQGGKANGCGIPSSATSVELTATAVDASSGGFLRLFPAAEPQATFLNYPTGFNPSNTGTVALCGSDGGLCLVNNDLRVKNFGGPTDLVIDVQGYYQQQLAAHVLANGNLSRNNRATAATNLSTGTYTVIFDRDISECSYSGNTGTTSSGTANGFISIQPFGSNDNGVFVRVFDVNGVQDDLPFYVNVTC